MKGCYMKVRTLCVLVIGLLSVSIGCGKKDNTDENIQQVPEKAAAQGDKQDSDISTDFAFPDALASEMKGSFAQGDPILDAGTIQGVVRTLQKKKAIEKQRENKVTQEEMIGFAKECGFTDEKDFINASSKAFAGFGLVSAIAEYQVMIKLYRSQGKNEAALRQIKQTKIILSARIKSSKLTIKDIEVLKKHWETWKEVADL